MVDSVVVSIISKTAECFSTLCITLKPTELKHPKKMSGADTSEPCIRFLGFSYN